MIHTPVHASWLNQIEIFFSVIQKKVVTPNDFASLGELSATLLGFVDRYNQTARPFSWKFTAADLHDLMDRISRHEQQEPLKTNRYRRPHDNPRRTSGATHLRCGLDRLDPLLVQEVEAVLCSPLAVTRHAGTQVEAAGSSPLPACDGCLSPSLAAVTMDEVRRASLCSIRLPAAAAARAATAAQYTRAVRCRP